MSHDEEQLGVPRYRGQGDKGLPLLRFRVSVLSAWPRGKLSRPKDSLRGQVDRAAGASTSSDFSGWIYREATEGSSQIALFEKTSSTAANPKSNPLTRQKSVKQIINIFEGAPVQLSEKVSAV